MKFSKTFLYGIFSVLLLVFFVMYRRESLLHVTAAFFALMWFVQIPGSLILALSEGKSENFLRLVLFGNVIGLALVPLLYYLLFRLDLHASFSLVISVLNVLLGLMLVIRIRKNNFTFSPPGKKEVQSMFLLLAVVMVICSFREFSQMISWKFSFNSKHDTDAGILMSMVVALKNYGFLVNMNYGSAAINYHHFVYLLMALVMKTSHIGILPLYQVVFPLYTFFFMALAAYYLALSLKASERIAVISAIAVLLLDDFYLLNQVIKLVIHKQPVFTIESIEWLHNSPSAAISFLVMFVILAELARSGKEKISWKLMLLLVVSASTLACYKISTWACLAGGMVAASVLNREKNKSLVLVAAGTAVAGFLVNKFLSGVAHSTYSSDGMDVNLAYPVMRSEAVKNYLHFHGDVFSFHDLSLKTAVVLALLTAFYIAGIFGVRLFYLVKKMKGGVLKNDFATSTIIFSVFGGILVSFFVTPKVGQHNALYFILTGMYLLSVVSVLVISEFLVVSKNFFLKATAITLIGIQAGSGALQVLQPVINPVKSSGLSKEWFDAMDYLKKNTEQNSLLAYNRFQLKENYYKDDFDFVPVYSERAVVVGGKQYFPDYEMKKSKLDTLFSSASPGDLKRISNELNIDYIVFDKWKGGSMACTDSSLITPVFTNNQVDVFKLKK
ncbi:MAG: hypothetical protein NT126_07600 [Bacteroidetes bacterium]|nr:hypothetical protein [Bacteroidota bacterium]